ncbi:bacterio-opsin activator domain-containing protein [Haladaptatus sp. NG-SE-30]
MIRAHPHQVYNATVTQNFAYLSPEEFFNTETPTANSDEFVETHLDRIRAQGKLKEREQDLSTLAETSQELLRGEGDIDEIVTRLADTLFQALSPSIVAIFWYDEETDELQPHTVRRPSEDANTITLPKRYRKLLWDTFVIDDQKVFSNFRSETEIPEMGATLQSGMALPVDRYGVVLIASTRAYAFEETDVEVASAVAATAQSALERAEHERTLEQQNEQLQHLNRINSTIRRIDQGLVQASSREECETVVCDRLAETDSYKFVWIGDRDPLTDQFIPREWAGEGESYLDELSPPIDDDEADDGDGISSPAQNALETGDVVTVKNVLTTSRYERWREVALANGFHSVISIPLVHNDTEYGALNVYAGSPNVFSEMEQDVLAELGATTEYSIDAAETRAGLHADRITEVGLRITDSQSRLLRLARQIDGPIDVETVLPENDGELRLFFTMRGVSSETVLTACEESVSVDSVRQVTERNDEPLFEAVVSVDSLIPSTMAGFVASITDLMATPDAVELTVELPQSADVRAFVNRFQQAYPDTAVESVQRVTQPIQTNQSFYADVEERLTERQFETLKLAYHSGYFEWPRDSTGEEVAKSLGVAQPTFTGHLRAGERKLFDLLFD